jgi:tRNA-specific 2-thiouridylase
MAKPKVCVAMSGGVDSSVAALLLQQQGYDVTGAFMKNWSLEQQGVLYKPWQDEARDAEAVCKQLGVPFYVFDFEAEYQKRVVESFVHEYKQGRTPNPDVLCNREIKFDLFLREARKHGAQFMATGHYAQIEQTEQGGALLAGRDTAKDQSYFLYTLTQKELPYCLFPIGHMLKSKVRQFAIKHNLPNATKKDSQGICFIGPVSMRKFLQHYIQAKPGNVVTPEGEILGQHDGIMFYTEGQRHGFDTKGSHVPLYVAQKRLQTNELVVVPSDHPLLTTHDVTLEQITWVDAKPRTPFLAQARVRYRQPLHKVQVDLVEGTYRVKFNAAVQAVSLGQSLVIYQGEQVIGGGVINARLA